MHILDFEVRDSELDAQGIVNNSFYFVYFAHARHKYINEFGIDFVEMAKQNQNLLLISTKIDFKQPLKSGDSFTIHSQIVPEGPIKFAFKQQIYRNNKVLISDSYNICTCIDGNNRGRPYIPQLIQKHLVTNS